MSINAYGILYPDYISVIKSTSNQGLSSETDKGIFFGIVDAVNYANVRTSVGNTVLFDANRARLVTQSANSWFIIHEDDIIFKENTPPT